MGPRQSHTRDRDGGRDESPGFSAGHKLRSARIKLFTAAERIEPAAAGQNVPVGRGANACKRFAPPALKYNCNERALSQMPKIKIKKLLARSSDSLAIHCNLTRPVPWLCSHYLLSLLARIGRYFFLLSRKLKAVTQNLDPDVTNLQLLWDAS